MAFNIQRRTSDIANVVVADASRNVTLPADLTVTALVNAGLIKANAQGKFVAAVAGTDYGTGTVTSVALATGTTGTDVNVSGSPITGSGTITLNIPDASTTARGLVTTGSQTFAGEKTFNSNIRINKQSNTASFLAIQSGSSSFYSAGSGYLSISSSYAGSLTVNFGSAGQTAYIQGDYLTTGQSYYLPNASGTIALVGGSGVGTVTSVGLSSATSGVTIGSTPITTSGTITLTIATASGSQQGLLSSADWTTFNNKFTLPSLTSGSVLFSNGTTIAQDNANFFWDDTSNNLGIGTNVPSSAKLHIVASSSGFVHEKTSNQQFYGMGFNGNNGYLTYYTDSNFIIGYGTITGNSPSVNTLVLTTSGNVGIGTSSPTQKLTVEGAAGYLFTVQENSANKVRLQGYVDANEAALVSGYDTTAKPLTFYVNASKRVEIKTTGQLQFNNYQSTTSFSGTVVGYLAFDASGNILTASGSGGSTTPGGSNGQVQFNSSGSFGADSNFFWDNTNKRLGVGTSSPSYLLDVNGAARAVSYYANSQELITSDGSANYLKTAATLYIQNGGTTVATISNSGAATFNSSVTATTGLTIGSLSSGSNAVLTLATNASGSPRSISYVAANADITINATSGSALMTVKNSGQLQFNNYQATTSFSGTVVGYLAFDASGNILTTAAPAGGVTSVALATGTTGTDVNVSGSPITGSGTITLNIPDASATARGLITTGTQTIAGAKTFSSNLTAPAFFESSDARLKSNIREYNDEVLATVKAKIYTKNGRTEIGYLAQDVESVYSEAVDNSGGYKTLSYREVHTAKIAALENEIRELKNKLNALV